MGNIGDFVLQFIIGSRNKEEVRMILINILVEFEVSPFISICAHDF